MELVQIANIGGLNRVLNSPPVKLDRTESPKSLITGQTPVQQHNAMPDAGGEVQETACADKRPHPYYTHQGNRPAGLRVEKYCGNWHQD